MSNAAGKAPADEGDVVPRNEFGSVPSCPKPQTPNPKHQTPSTKHPTPNLKTKPALNCWFRVQGLARKVWRVEPLVSGRVLGVYVEVLCCEYLVHRISRVSRVSRVLHRQSPRTSSVSWSRHRISAPLT